MTKYAKIRSVEFDGVDTRDYPDFCDAHITYAELDGRELTEKELEEVNDDSDLVHELLMENLF